MNTPSSGCDAEKVREAIDEFFTVHLLSWIEVFVIMGKLGVGVHAINDIRKWYISVSCESFLPNPVLIAYPGRLSLQVG